MNSILGSVVALAMFKYSMSFYKVVVNCMLFVFVFVCLCQFPGADEFPHSGDGQFDQDGCGCQVSSPPAACCALCLSYYNIFSI